MVLGSLWCPWEGMLQHGLGGLWEFGGTVEAPELQELLWPWEG